jgi:MFS transporter, CP family, cyanate transporter
MPLIMFGGVSFGVYRVRERLGTDGTVAIALVVLAMATVVRSLSGPVAALWLGTAVLGAAIAVCNVLVPVVVRRDFPGRVTGITGAYSATLGGCAAVASGVAVPLSQLGGWQLAVGVWAVPSGVAALAWTWRMRFAPSPASAADSTLVAPHSGSNGAAIWRSRDAWQVTVFFGLQATTYYLFVTWLPTIEASHGVSSLAAGWHLFVFQLVSVVASLATGWIMHRAVNHRLIGVVISALMVVAALGHAVAAQVPVLWDCVAGLSTGAALVFALSIISLRSETSDRAVRLSAMAQGLGYCLAAAGPLVAGLVFDLASSWRPVLVGLAAIGVCQAAVAVLVGRPVRNSIAEARLSERAPDVAPFEGLKRR